MNLFDSLLLQKIGHYLLREEETISVAESETSGLLQYGFSTVPDAEKFFQGGITAYNLGQKCKHLNVEPIHAMAFNCVSQQVATEMALQVCKLFNSHWGIGITGYTTPVPESDQKIFAYYSIVYKKELKLSACLEPLTEDPAEVQIYYANEVYEELGSSLLQAVPTQ